MKGLKARVKGVLGSLGMTVTLSLLWSNALGQATPDQLVVPEPGLLPLFAIAAVAMFLARRRR